MTSLARSYNARGRGQFLGYDARDLDDASNVANDPRWVKGFCYRSDIWRPLSADEWTWPHPSWLCTRDFFGPQMLCQKVNELREDINSSRPPSNAPYSIIAFSFYPFASAASAAWVEWDQPEFEPRGARLLGYDVCDWMISAVSNCGLAEDGTRSERWTHRINRFHLLDSLDDALEFVAYADDEVPEHAPFVPIGVWLVEAVGITIR